MLIGIDWGGTKIEGVALTEDGKELARRREPTPRHDYRACIQLIAGLVQNIEQETGKTGSIGIGIPGSLDPKSRLGKGASSTWIIGKPVEEDLRKAIGREIRVENDADCLAASEAVDGAGAGFNLVYAVILGSSTGAGIAVGGRAHHGPNNNAGEWGHNPLPFPDITEIPGPPCFCGKHGCLASWVSGLGFQDDYQRHTGIHIAADDIIRKMRSGDRLARLVWRRYVNRLARGLSLVVNALCYVASGSLIGYVEQHINSWDCLGALAIIQAAGGKTNDFLANDGLWKGNRLIAGPEALYPTLESFFEC
jgi:fructokinase